MNLTLASLEYGDYIQFPNDPDFKYVPQFETIREVVFDESQWVIVDNHSFENCKFVRCHLVYSGGPFAFHECEIGFEVSLSLSGSALRGQVLSEAFVEGQEQDIPIPLRG